MAIEQRIIAFCAILANLTSCVHSEEECPTGPCLQDKPKLGPQDKLEIGFFYDQYSGGNADVADMDKYICNLIQTCGDSILVKLKPGARVTKDENGNIVCGDFCEGDRKQVCFIITDPAFSTSCGCPPADIGDCLKNEIKKVDNILIQNGEERRSLNIPDCKLPAAITFNGNVAEEEDKKLESGSCVDLLIN